MSITYLSSIYHLPISMYASVCLSLIYHLSAHPSTILLLTYNLFFHHESTHIFVSTFCFTNLESDPLVSPSNQLREEISWHFFNTSKGQRSAGNHAINILDVGYKHSGFHLVLRGTFHPLNLNHVIHIHSRKIHNIYKFIRSSQINVMSMVIENLCYYELKHKNLILCLQGNIVKTSRKNHFSVRSNYGFIYFVGQSNIMLIYVSKYMLNNRTPHYHSPFVRWWHFRIPQQLILI